MSSDHGTHSLQLFRDSDASAPAEYPPDQPEVDSLDDDGTAYGAEEAELEAALVKELAEAERRDGVDEDQEMGGTETITAPRNEGSAKDDDDDESDAGSEDLEAESSGSDDEDLEEDEGGEGEGDEDVEMG